MKGNWLYLGLCFVIIGLLDSFVYRMATALFFMFFLHFYIEKGYRKYYVCMLSVLILFSYPFQLNLEKGRVVAIRNSYQIVSNGLNQVMIYSSDPNVGLDDVVLIPENLKQINGYQNFEKSSFISWAKGQNIVATLNLEQYTILKKGTSFRRLLFDYNIYKGNDWANMLLFGTGIQTDSDFKYLIVSSGLHIAALAQILFRLFSFLFYPKRARKNTINVLLILAMLFHFPYGYIRVLISWLAKEWIEDRRDRLGINLILMVLYKPYHVLSASFLLPFGIQLIGVCGKEKSWFTSLGYIAVIQLYLNGVCDIVSLLGFRIWQAMASALYLFALISSFLPFSLPMSQGIVNGIMLLDNVPKVQMSGQLSVVMVIVAMNWLSHLAVSGKKRYMIYIVILLLLNQYQRVLMPFYTITYLDVGQGDCCLITFPFSARGLLIDTSGNYYKDMGGDVVIPYLQSMGVHEVDIIISHHDNDHDGALESIQSKYRVGDVIDEKNDYMQFQNLKVYALLADQQFDNENDNSIICYFNIEGMGFLFLGDVSSNVERQLVQQYELLNVDVVKLSHHGSSTGSSEQLFAGYQPKLAVISAGRNNRYGHPSQQTVDTLESFNVHYLATKWDHAIRFYVFRYGMFYQTVSNKCGLYFPES